MKYLTEVERKQRVLDDFNGFTFEYTTDLSSEVLIHPPSEYTNEALCVAVSQLIGMFMSTTYNKLNGFSGFDNIKFKIK
jgi:hypothetical protein